MWPRSKDRPDWIVLRKPWTPSIVIVGWLRYMMDFLQYAAMSKEWFIGLMFNPWFARSSLDTDSETYVRKHWWYRDVTHAPDSAISKINLVGKKRHRDLYILRNEGFKKIHENEWNGWVILLQSPEGTTCYVFFAVQSLSSLSQPIKTLHYLDPRCL
jgi:hypothetical protein